MADFFAEKLASLGFALTEGATLPSEKLVKKFEKRFGLKLPADLRVFLLRHGGVQGQARCPFLEPTPLGLEVCIEGFFGFDDDEIAEETEMIEGAPAVIALGREPLGKMFWLFCAPPYAGHVYVHDHEGRAAWSDATFLKRYPDLAPEVHSYLELRREGKLAKKPEGFEHVYLAARGFTEFMESLQPAAA